jgi:MSHA biogenesis protein MshP
MKGFVLISAIFLLVVIAALGLFALTVSNTQQQNSVMDALGSRAYQAAKTGIEWGSYQITKGGGTCAASSSLTMPAGTQLSAFTVTVNCTAYPTPSTQYTDGTNLDGSPKNFSVYQLTSTATMGTVGSASYFERQLQVAVKNP